jgi:hypothetical protein
LTEIETEDILFMREEEQMPHDINAHKAANVFTSGFFSNIAVLKQFI